MKLSIIIPVYNGAKYLQTLFQCLDAQTCGSFEAIFVDDGSSDETEASFEKLKQAYPRVSAVMYRKENGGVSSARNLGIDRATGDVLSFCDVDDQISPHYVDDILSCLEKSGVDFLCWKFRYCQEHHVAEWQEEALRFAVVEREDVLEQYLYKSLVLSCVSCAVKTAVVRQYGLRYDESARYSEDLNFVWKMLLASKTVGCIDNVLYHYVIHPDSAMGRFDEARLGGYRIALELTDFVYKMAPDFAPLYEKYEGARLLWSISWQGAQCLTKKAYYAYFAQLPLRQSMQALASFPKRSIRLSARVYLLSPELYRLIIRAFARMKRLNG